MKTVLQIGLLIGILPIAIATGIALVALRLGADNWPGVVFETTFTALWFALVLGGAYVFARRPY